MDDARKIPTPFPRHVKGRGAGSQVAGRFEVTRAEGEDDGWGSFGAELADMPNPATEVREERARSVISRNDSPDIG